MRLCAMGTFSMCIFRISNCRGQNYHHLLCSDWVCGRFNTLEESSTFHFFTKFEFLSQIDPNSFIILSYILLIISRSYAPFCKHIFIPNFLSGLKVGAMPITPDNVHLVKSGYKARTEKELPVLMRWFPHDAVDVPDAKFLDLILYSYEQVVKENAAMGNTMTTDKFDWGLISIKGQLEDYETPMTPITVMRNALGKEEGSSGVPLERAKYMEAVEYWEKHAAVV
jgi:hypothetical protein